jgi:perosamine synthetase
VSITATPISMASPQLGPDEREAVLRVLDSGRLAQGEEVAAFEREFAAWCGTGHAVAVNSGTAALHLLLLAHGVGPGDEVLTSPFTFIASANAALFVGARPVFADVEPDTLCLDPDRVEAAMTPRTRAIVAVDLYGQPADIDRLRALADSRGVVLIEDACQAHGARLGERKAGALGVPASFSFYPTKNMTTGEGGMVTTASPEIAAEVKRLRQHGASKRYEHDVLGYNYRLTDIAAAVGRAQLRKLDSLNAARRRNAQALTRGLARTPGVTTPVERRGVTHAYHQYTLRIARDREGVRRRLSEMGVDTAVHYPIPVHRQPLYARLGYAGQSFPVAEQAAREVLSLPVHPGLTEGELARIVDAVRKAVSSS